MSYETLIDRLTEDLKPVRRRRPWMDALVIAAVCAVELGLFFAFGMARPDMADEMGRMSLWWRLSGLGVVALVAGAGAIASFNPVRSPKRALRVACGLVALALAFGWAVGAARAGGDGIVQRLDWVHGVHCAGKIVLLSVAPLAGLAVRMRRGAATDAARTALLAGLAAACWGAFVFVFACPFNDPLYIAVWYSVGGGIVVAVSRLILPRLARW